MSKNAVVMVSSFIHSYVSFSFAINVTNFFIYSLNMFVLKKSCVLFPGFLQLSAICVPSICKYTF